MPDDVNTDNVDTKTTPPAAMPPADPAKGGNGGVTLDGKGQEAPASGAAGSPKPADTPKPANVTLNGKDDTGAGKEDGTDDGGKPDAGEADYAYRYPEGFQGNERVEAALTAFAKENNIAPDKAQAIADLGVEMFKDFNAKLVDELTATRTKWADELKNDPDFGGGNLKRTAEDANRALRHFAPELIPLLPQWNLDTQPDLIRVFARLGRSIREGVSPKNQGAAADADKDPILADKEAVLAGKIPGPNQL